VLGTAVPRPPLDTNLIAFPLYGPWGRWVPWYGNGFGWNLGFVTYNPWYYGATRWTWGRYGFWYDPYIYDPYPYYGASAGYSSGGGGRSREPKSMIGSIRLRVSPGTAQVYVDGALVGTVDEFDGFSDHLELDAGRHAIELRAEGYETYLGTIDVEAGKTLTKRVSLKKRTSGSE
jgi:PEGA domain-containing protein